MSTMSIMWSNFRCLLMFFLLCQISTVLGSNRLEFMEVAEVKQLLNDEKYVVILLSMVLASAMRSPFLSEHTLPGDEHECVGKCRELEETLASVREDVVESLNAWVVRTHSPELSKEYGLIELKLSSAVVVVRSGIPLLYTGPADDDEFMLHYLVTNVESAVHLLSDQTFEHETQAATGATTGDWMVMFTKAGCDTCIHMRATAEAIAAGLRGRKNVAIVDRDTDGGQTTRRFGVKDFPSFILFRLGRLYRFDLPLMDAGTLMAFASEGFRNARAEDIPHPKTPFDDLVEQCADWLRENPSIVNAVIYASVGLLAVIAIAAAGFFKSSPAKPTKKQETKKKK